jgi:hypothetical protein
MRIILSRKGFDSRRPAYREQRANQRTNSDREAIGNDL